MVFLRELIVENLCLLQRRAGLMPDNTPTMHSLIRLQDLETWGSRSVATSVTLLLLLHLHHVTEAAKLHKCGNILLGFRGCDDEEWSTLFSCLHPWLLHPSPPPPPPPMQLQFI